MSIASIPLLAKDLMKGHRKALAQAITLIESENETHQLQSEHLISLLNTLNTSSLRIGVSGVPGVGKSTLIDALGMMIIHEGKKVAVLAIDPSSTQNKGSILGDKTRMEQLSKQENAFIRPSPSKGFLGGLAASTADTILLCEAAGYEVIFIETIGVGQSETEVALVCDVFLYLSLANTGDELQGIKKGILEWVDLVFINKVHQENDPSVIDAFSDVRNALQLQIPKYDYWNVPVLKGAALEKKGLDALWQEIQNLQKLLIKYDDFEQTRKMQNLKLFQDALPYYFIRKLKNNHDYTAILQKYLEQVSTNKISRIEAQRLLINELFSTL